ncbi:MAG: hypothetical protein IJP30_01565 [Clostridia bacterium]|nr:hypothetical protein [Clostridia bacterium]
MGILDYALLALIGAALFFAVKFSRKNKCASCSSCSNPNGCVSCRANKQN